MRTLVGLQYLRALASIAVVLFHCGGKGGFNFAVGKSGVDLFFILSGFLMVTITNETTRPIIFLRDRLFRIVPIYWIGTTVFLVGALLGLFPQVVLSIGHVLSSYSFIPSISPSDGHLYPMLVPGWTLNYEVFFYLVFALALGLKLGQLATVLATSVLFAGLMIAGALLQPSSPIGLTYTDPLLLEFLIGAWIGLAWKNTGLWPKLFGWPLLAIGTIAIAASSFADKDIAEKFRVIYYAVPMAALFVSVLWFEQRNRIRSNFTLRYAGDASYSIYVFHTLAISLAAKLAASLNLQGMGLRACIFFFALSVGLLAYTLIERPIIKFVNAHIKLNKRSNAFEVSASHCP